MYIFLQEIIHNYSISKSGLLCNLYGILLITEYEIPVLFFSFFQYERIRYTRPGFLSLFELNSSELLQCRLCKKSDILLEDLVLRFIEKS